GLRREDVHLPRPGPRPREIRLQCPDRRRAGYRLTVLRPVPGRRPAPGARPGW
ncbi:MAG: hypothetical protein AVDCRST_MAG33-2856, partial [uncultured Thermomicrobiales bacterium]